jgi:PAS domain S-box-containing protein
MLGKVLTDDGIFKTIAEYSPNMIFINQQRRIVYVNKKCEEVLGYSREEFFSPGFDFRRLIAPESKALIAKVFARHQRGEEVEPYEYMIVTKSGRRLNAIITTKLVFIDNKPAILGMVTDTDARKQAEALYRRVFENAGAATVIYNTDGLIERINDEAEKLSGWSRAEAEHKMKWMAFIAREDLSWMKKSNKQRRSDPALMPKRYEFKFINKAGEVRNALMNVDFIPELNKFVASLLDITSLKQAEAVLRRDKEVFAKLVAEKTAEVITAQRELERSKHLANLGTMAAAVAHELRNPLGVIAAALFNIRRKTRDRTLQRHLDNIEAKIAESDRTISDLLSFSRIKMPKLRPVCLTGLLDECVAAAEKKFGVKSGTVRKRYALKGKRCEIKADRHQLKLVVGNVLDNAFQALAGQPGKIGVSLRLGVGGRPQAVIKDNGQGIGPKELPKVFDPFFTTKTKGTGLGLTLSRELMHLCGGDIRIESKKNQGARIYLTFSR